MLVVVILCGGAWYAIGRKAGPHNGLAELKPQPYTPTGMHFAPELQTLQQERESLNQKIEQLKETREKLEESNRGLLDANRQLESQQKQLQQEIDQLTVNLGTLNQMVDSQFMLVTTDSRAVGVRQDGPAIFRVLEKTEGNTAALTLRMAHRRNIPLIGRDPELTRTVYMKCEPGSTLPSDLVQRVSSFWRVHRFVPIGPTEPLQFVCFRDLGLNRTRMGIYLDHDKQHLKLLGFDQREEVIPRSRIEPGTARKGQGSGYAPSPTRWTSSTIAS